MGNHIKIIRRKTNSDRTLQTIQKLDENRTETKKNTIKYMHEKYFPQDDVNEDEDIQAKIRQMLQHPSQMRMILLLTKRKLQKLPIL